VIVLIQVGKSSWVDPDAIQAVKWNSARTCPELLLSGNATILAYDFQNKMADTNENREKQTLKLLAHLHTSLLARVTK